jgi:hypothetical protein
MDTRTRSGRVSKPPTRYEPVEVVEDDYADDDYDDDESEVSSNISYDSEEEGADDEASSINEFVVEDSSESDKSDDEEKPSNGRKPVQKRPAKPPTGGSPTSA